MKEIKRIALLAGCVCAVAVAPIHEAKATFIIDTNPSGEHTFIDTAHHGVTAFTMFVGANNPSAPHVGVTTTGAVDTGSGFATIKPSQGGSLTDLIFTPADQTLFSDFSFRGQLEPDALGSLTLTVQDNQGKPAQTFTFSGLGSQHDFARIGIVSSDETIQSITITSDFKEFKQIEMSFAGAPPPVPDGGATVMLLGAALGMLSVTGRFLTRRT